MYIVFVRKIRVFSLCFLETWDLSCGEINLPLRAIGGTRIIFAGQLSRRTKITAGPAGNNVRFNCRAPAQVKLGERSVKHLADESGKVEE